MATPRLQQLQSFLENSPNDAFILFAIAKEYEKMDDKTTALENYLLLKQHHPNYVGLYYHLGKLYEQFDDFDTALAIYTEGMEVAKAAGDRHALGELAEAKMMIEE